MRGALLWGNNTRGAWEAVDSCPWAIGTHRRARAAATAPRRARRGAAARAPPAPASQASRPEEVKQVTRVSLRSAVGVTHGIYRVRICAP